jgi:phosphate butyryltransferase (EC 2.3.1.19)
MKKIREIAKELDFDLSNIEVIDEKDGTLAARKATELVSSGKACVLMKGLIDTSIIMKQVLDHEIGLRTGNVISHIALFEVPTYHKMFIVTDAAMLIAPDLNQKKGIIENAVSIAHKLGVEMPKVAVLAAKEKVSEKNGSNSSRKALKRDE